MNLKDPLFEQAKETYANTFKKMQERALPQSVLRVLYFANSEGALRSAIEAGEVEELEENGKKFCTLLRTPFSPFAHFQNSVLVCVWFTGLDNKVPAL